ncbi:MAG TPA: hypothetical protein VKZ60_12730, partial [Chloroflexota bacterium]|nr:hypothetical protein [Chloroflexota bacterium]
MTRVLLLGMAPLPTENTLRSYAAGLRTWQFARGLRAAGHEVTLVCRRIPHVYPPDVPPVATYIDADLGVQRIDVDEAVCANERFLRSVLEVFRPDCIVGAHHYGAELATRLDTALPVWADLNGHLMAEAQAKAF